jgi:site-specific recombinase XerD
MSECRKFRTQLALNSFRMGDLPPYTSWKKCRRLSSNRRHLDPEGALPGRVPVDGVEHFIFIRKYKLLRRQMQEYAEKNGLSFIDEFDLSTLGMFRSGWKDGPRSSAKKLERMRAFFRFAQRRNWISNNPTIDLKAPKVTLSPTLPFNHEEMRRILEATERYKEEMPNHGVENGRRIRGLVLLIRYSGMRIGDAVNFNTERLEGNRVFHIL